MERYYGRLTIIYDNGHYRNLRVYWLSFTGNIVEAGSELLKFMCGLSVIDTIADVRMQALLRESEVDTWEKGEYVNVYDKYALREQITPTKKEAA
jgi:hypothetical protein